jgi:hypothetical protein
MKNHLFIFLLTALAFQAWGQKTIEGIVYDIGTRETLSGVVVKSSNTGISSQTNAEGFFTILINPYSGQNAENSDQYAVLNNSVYWDLKEEVEIKMFSLEGTGIFSAKSLNAGKMDLPVPAAGFYILNITSGGQHIKLLLFSDGTSLNPAKAKNTSTPTPLHDSSLFFTKPGYYPQEVGLNDSAGFIRVNLLKKSYDDLDYFNELPNYEAFYMLQGSPPKTNYGEIESIKALYDFVDDTIYYTNVKKYPSHFSFAETVLGYEYGSVNFFWTQYNISPWRYLNLITINYHQNIGKYVFEFDPWDRVDCDGIEATYQKLLQTAYFKENLYFHANSLQWNNCPDVPLISSEELYMGQNYQALNPEENYGFLRKVEIAALPATYLGRHDLIILDGIPNDVSVVAGIITTEFQTPLSHINILSHNRHTPNMALKDGWTNPRLDSLLGELVFLKVESDSFYIRKANIGEATIFWNQREPQTPVVLDKDTETSGLIELAGASIFSVKTIGGKAANLAELVILDSIPLPEDFFTIPFYYYQQHIATHGFDTVIQNMLAEEAFISNLEFRSTKLAQLRQLIIDAPLDPALTAAVMNRIQNFGNFDAYKFRSSTNAEDLESFSGAGLYDSFSAKKGSSSKTVDKAIKQVWASLWNLRAFDERDYYKIDENSVAMGVLVNRSFPNEDANGVVITRNLYNGNHGYIINVQYKEYSIVYPEPGIMNDQIITYTINLDNQKYTIEYLTQSNLPQLGGQTVLTDDEIYELADYCTRIKNHYYYDLPNNCNCGYESFAVDIEFKLDSEVENRKIYIKQARIYAAD